MNKILVTTIFFTVSSFNFIAYTQSNKLISSSISVQADPVGLFANTLVLIINSVLDNDLNDDDYNEEYENQEYLV